MFICSWFITTCSHALVSSQIAEMKNCNKCVYFENRKKKDLYMWVANVPHGPSVKFLVLNGKIKLLIDSHSCRPSSNINFNTHYTLTNTISISSPYHEGTQNDRELLEGVTTSSELWPSLWPTTLGGDQRALHTDIWHAQPPPQEPALPRPRLLLHHPRQQDLVQELRGVGCGRKALWDWWAWVGNPALGYVGMC